MAGALDGAQFRGQFLAGERGRRCGGFWLVPLVVPVLQYDFAPVLQQTEATANGIVRFDALHHAAPGPDEAVSLLRGMGQTLAPGGTCWSP